MLKMSRSNEIAGGDNFIDIQKISGEFKNTSVIL